jgi:hypothetical protein
MAPQGLNPLALGTQHSAAALLILTWMQELAAVWRAKMIAM